MSQKLEIFAIFDKKGDDYGVPFFQLSTGVAKRTFSDLVLDPRSFLYAHPEDYDLYFLGYYYSDSGRIESEHPRYVCSAAEFSAALKGVQGDVNPLCPSATDDGKIKDDVPVDITGKDYCPEQPL